MNAPKPESPGFKVQNPKSVLPARHWTVDVGVWTIVVNPKLVYGLLGILFFSSLTYAQSGRRPTEIKPPTLPPEVETNEAKDKPGKAAELPQVTAEKNQDYRCTDDGTLARILETDSLDEAAVSPKEVDTRLVITAKPRPAYTREARRLGVQGFVTLKVLFSARGEIGRLRVIKGLRAGLTENAIRAACRIEFKPALKDGQPVAQLLTVEYVFRLADSAIFSP